MELTFIIESIYSVYTGALMVTTQEKEVLRIFDLVGEQKTDGFQTLFPSVHIIPEEKIIGLRGKSTILKQPQQIIVLAMGIS